MPRAKPSLRTHISGESGITEENKTHLRALLANDGRCRCGQCGDKSSDEAHDAEDCPAKIFVHKISGIVFSSYAEFAHPSERITALNRVQELIEKLQMLVKPIVDPLTIEGRSEDLRLLDQTLEALVIGDEANRTVTKENDASASLYLLSQWQEACRKRIDELKNLPKQKRRLSHPTLVLGLMEAWHESFDELPAATEASVFNRIVGMVIEYKEGRKLTDSALKGLTERGL